MFVYTEFADVRAAMDALQFKKQEQDDIMQMLAAVLHLGNIDFAEAGMHIYIMCVIIIVYVC